MCDKRAYVTVEFDAPTQALIRNAALAMQQHSILFGCPVGLTTHRPFWKCLSEECPANVG